MTFISSTIFQLMLALLAIAVLLLLICGPQLWVSTTISRYSKERNDIPGSGGQFAKHLLNKLNLGETVCVEEAKTPMAGDHYHPIDKAVRLSKKNYHCHSLSAIVIAAHEVGHAIQDAEDNPWMARRTRLAKLSSIIQMIAPIALSLSPLLTLITKSPLIGGATLAIGALSIFSGTLMTLMSLPLEFDASFNKALPILEEGQYLKPEDLHAAHKLLKAAALTYVAASLMNLLNIGYWLTRLRRL